MRGQATRCAELRSSCWRVLLLHGQLAESLCAAPRRAATRSCKRAPRQREPVGAGLRALCSTKRARPSESATGGSEPAIEILAGPGRDRRLETPPRQNGPQTSPEQTLNTLATQKAA